MWGISISMLCLMLLATAQAKPSGYVHRRQQSGRSRQDGNFGPVRRHRSSCRVSTIASAITAASASTLLPVISTTSSSSSLPSSSMNVPGQPLVSIGGIIDILGNGAIPFSTVGAGPNGAESWFNTGIDGAGWQPPMLTLDQLITMDLDQVLSDPNSLFQPCAPYLDTFNAVASQLGLPAILIASTAMQESTCNPSATGGNGEAGLMQLGSQNCVNAPGGNCYDIGYNIYTGASYFQSTLNAANGNVLVALGRYNGWTIGMTAAQATAMRWADCTAQNNLDYLQSTLNGFILGIDGHTLGTVRNLDACY